MIDPGQAGLLAGAGFVAGVVNTVAGAGSLLTFPALLGAGLSPLAANVSNCLGVIPGSASGAYGLRDQLRGQRSQLVRLSLWVGLGSLVGAVLLLALPGGAFDRVVPVLVGLAGLLVLAQPLVLRLVRREESGPPGRVRGAPPDTRRPQGRVAPLFGRVRGAPPDPRRRDREPSSATGPVIGAVGIYSGYFGAAQGVLLIGALGILAPQPLPRVNAVKNVVAVAANGVAGIVYAVVAPVHWSAVLLLAVGSGCGGPLGALLARRVPAGPLRLGIAAVALVVAVRLGLSAW